MTTRQLSTIRGTLAKLTLLCVIVHPGSAATFENTKSFLLSRYPNRHVVVEASGRLRLNADSRKGVPSLTSIPCFVRPSAAGHTMSHLYTTSTPRPSSTTQEQLQTFHTSAAPACPASPRRGRAIPVVIGDFISALEKRGGHTRGGGVVPPTHRTINGIDTLAPNGAGLMQSEPSVILVGASSAGDAHVRPSSRPSASEGGPRGMGLLKRGALSLLEACDSVVSFVEAKALRAMAGVGSGSDSVKRIVTTELSSSGGGAALKGKERSPMMYDLVGYMDVDPFERSRRYFKRSSRMLL